MVEKIRAGSDAFASCGMNGLEKNTQKRNACKNGIRTRKDRTSKPSKPRGVDGVRKDLQQNWKNVAEDWDASGKE